MQTKGMLARGRKTSLVPCLSSVEIVMCLWIACVVLTLVDAQQKFYIQGRYGKRQEPHTGESLELFLLIFLTGPPEIEINSKNVMKK